MKRLIFIFIALFMSCDIADIERELNTPHRVEFIINEGEANISFGAVTLKNDTVFYMSPNDFEGRTVSGRADYATLRIEHPNGRRVVLKFRGHVFLTYYRIEVDNVK